VYFRRRTGIECARDGTADIFLVAWVYEWLRSEFRLTQTAKGRPRGSEPGEDSVWSG
jgi:hypothetical protein